MSAFVYTATIVFIFLTLIWRRNSGIDLMLKLTFAGLSLWGIFVSLSALGFIVKG